MVARGGHDAILDPLPSPPSGEKQQPVPDYVTMFSIWPIYCVVAKSI